MIEPEVAFADLAANADFKRDGTLSIDTLLHKRTIERTVDAGKCAWLHGTRLAERLFGNAQAMNTMLLGLAWQRGLVPVGQAAILRSIELVATRVAPALGWVCGTAARTAQQVA